VARDFSSLIHPYHQLVKISLTARRTILVILLTFMSTGRKTKQQHEQQKDKDN
jgi:hypothetical protein